MKFTQSRFSVPELDCPSEEQTIRLALQNHSEVRRIAVDLDKRELFLTHSLGEDAGHTLAKAIPFKAIHLESISIEGERGQEHGSAQDVGQERRVLYWLLGLNLGMFVVEITTGLAAQSSGLVADGLDMLADSLVYLLSLVSIGMGLKGRIRATRFSAFFQGGLGTLTLIQASWRFIHGSEPEPAWMAGISLLALIVNVSCLLLISRFRTGRMHMQASWIFSANDVVVNLSVILAGGLVALSGSRYPDLIVGVGICLFVLRGALKIWRLSSKPDEALDLDEVR